MKKGFTLIELMAVVVILGVIALLVIPVIDKTMKQMKQDSYDTQIKSIYNAARDWGADHIPLLPATGATKYITLGDLKKNGDVDKDVKNPKTNEKFLDTMQIKITNINGKIKYEVLD